ncbi:hypothetical protein [Cohnella rhizosphaerae]|uniref:Uncharacterized protein n=1 Tax=Cohnella rhizosphaerae TaxID=1457232 RepID=A0A9X4QW83_9BACL|nr:hypothetical protein [Cohnella rhizosphaerae]MDG0813565.1 hypothetical protein [Cohnella rhizosphaerae]
MTMTGVNKRDAERGPGHASVLFDRIDHAHRRSELIPGDASHERLPDNQIFGNLQRGHLKVCQEHVELVLDLLQDHAVASIRFLLHARYQQPRGSDSEQRDGKKAEKQGAGQHLGLKGHFAEEAELAEHRDAPLVCTIELLPTQTTPLLPLVRSA